MNNKMTYITIPFPGNRTGTNSSKKFVEKDEISICYLRNANVIPLT